MVHFRILRLLRAWRVPLAPEDQPEIVGLIEMFVALLLLTHLCGCCWISILYQARLLEMGEYTEGSRNRRG